LASGFSLSADVLKVGHHGSNTSSTQKYLETVLPSYAIISCGAGNSYGHPHSETLDSLNKLGAAIYRTDEYGTISFTTDGKDISVSTTKQPTADPTLPPTEPPNEIQYIGNRNTKVFHLPTCRSLPQEQNRVYFNSRQDAIDAGYTSCSICKP
jgi:competence protein ComEC